MQKIKAIFNKISFSSNDFIILVSKTFIENKKNWEPHKKHHFDFISAMAEIKSINVQHNLKLDLVTELNNFNVSGIVVEDCQKISSFFEQELPLLAAKIKMDLFFVECTKFFDIQNKTNKDD